MNNYLLKMNNQLKSHAEAMCYCKTYHEIIRVYESYQEIILIYKPYLSFYAYRYFQRKGWALINSYKSLFLELNYRNRKHRSF